MNVLINGSMVLTKRFKLLFVTLLFWLATILSACAPAPYYSPHPVQHRPAHYYDYHYYPSVGVYFNLYSGRYYYRSGATWVNVRTLPSHVHISPQDRINLRIWSNKPYSHYDDHRKHYHSPPSYHPSRDRDRYERDYNRKHHEQYLKRYRP